MKIIEIKKDLFYWLKKKKKQVKPVSPSFRLNFFMSLGPWPPSDYSSLTLTSEDVQTPCLMDFILPPPGGRSTQSVGSIPSLRIWESSVPTGSVCRHGGRAHPLENHHSVAVLLLSYLCSHLCFPKSFKIIFLLLLKMKDKALKYETYTLCQALSRSYKFWKKFGGQEFPVKTKLRLRPSWSHPLGTVSLPGICRAGMLG